MNVTINSTVYAIGVSDYEPVFESGIKWSQVGGKHKALDRGATTAKWSADITVKASGTTIALLRQAMSTAAASGLPITLTCSAHETVFGPEFSYSSSYNCLVDAKEAFTTGNLNTSIPTEWTFTAYPTDYMPSRYLNNTGTFPTTVSMIGAQRLDNGDHDVIESAESRLAFGFGFSAPTAEITFEGTRSEVAQAKAYLQTIRSTAFTLSTALVWPFVVGDTSESVYVLDIDDNGPLDKASTFHSFTVVFGKA